MSTADIAVITMGVCDLATTAGAVLVTLRVADRIRITRGAVRRPGRGTSASAGAGAALIGARAERQGRFDALRAEGKTVAEAAEEIGLAAETARKYERRRKAAENGSDA